MSDDSGDPRVVALQQLDDALAAGDREAIDALLHPDFVGHAAEGLPLAMGGRHAGSEAMRTNRPGCATPTNTEALDVSVLNRHLDDVGVAREGRFAPN